MVVMVAGCGEKTQKLTPAQVSSSVEASLFAAGLLGTKAECPGVAATKGASIDCTVKADGMPYPVTATIAEVAKGKPRFELRWKNGNNGVVLRALAIPPVRTELWKEYAVDADVDCKDSLLLLDDKRSVTCDFDAKLIRTKLTITFDDKGKHTGWVTDPILINRKTMQAAVMTEVIAKAGPTAQIKCGDNPLAEEPIIVRPDNGKVQCVLTTSEKGTPLTGGVVIDVGPDRKVKSWEMR